ncbi:MAG: AAA family ATPase [Leptospiraceae bacterium]|nr:AAA family ATPase [Leptospiraceae bacterium]MDW8305854.1 AAA family ATPase [Leptospiraceae bacterium]
MPKDGLGLFDQLKPPLWVRLRPRSFQEFNDFASLGYLRERFLEEPFSLVLYGSPGTGKTTFLEILVKESGYQGASFPAASVGVEEVRELLHKSVRPVVLILDEIHRFAKSRQDVLLNPIEKGELILLGATTESPYHYLTRALLSRVVVKEIHPPDKIRFRSILEESWKRHDLESFPPVIWEEIAEKAWPDLRLAYQALEHILLYKKKNETEERLLYELREFFRNNRPIPRDIVSREYELMSALIKSVRGSDVDSALLYLATLLHIGSDPVYLARRLAILAAEDIGLSEPRALVLASSALTLTERIGLPEARIILSELVIYLCLAPKSNSAYKAIEKALDFVAGNEVKPPGHIVNTNPEIADYKYPHDFGGYVEQDYWPRDLIKKSFYKPPDLLDVFTYNEEEKLRRQWQNFADLREKSSR